MRWLTRTFAAHMITEIPVRLLSYINPFKPSAIFHPYLMGKSVYHYRDVMYIYHHFNKHWSISQANCEDPDETAYYAASFGSALFACIQFMGRYA